MATRDLHDQKILRALEGIEKQLSFQNTILKNASNEPHPNGIIRYQDGSLVRRTLSAFVNPDGSKTPLIPSESINYYVFYVNSEGLGTSFILNGKRLLMKENKNFLETAKEILFCYEGEV